MLKYILFGGPTKSVLDDRVHVVTANDLRRLYGLARDECILIDGDADLGKLRGVDRSTLRSLHPRRDGVYWLD